MSGPAPPPASPWAKPAASATARASATAARSQSGEHFKMEMEQVNARFSDAGSFSFN